MSSPVPSDRRHRRRQETIDEIVEVALSIMAEEGAGGLSLGEVGRRIGVRTPSLYVYFDSKKALYDEIFGRGWQCLLDVAARYEHLVFDGADPAGGALVTAEACTSWAVTHPAYAQLMFWRPVPGFAPSAAAYAPALALMRRTTDMIEALRSRGVLRPDVDVAAAVNAWTALISGVISQQLSNAPGEPYETGAFTRLLPDLVAMYLAHYGPEGKPDDRASTAGARPRASGDGSTPRRRTRDGATRGAARTAAKPRPR